MINIENASEEFINHVNNIELNNPRVQVKIDHTFRVSENCKKIATYLKLTEEQIQLAQLIGILHDIGRFEQYKIYNKNTNSIKLNNSIKFNHGKAGVEVLKKNQYIRKYIKDDKYDNIILTAIYEHNRYELSKNLSEEKSLFCKIIKDADKLDLIYEAIYVYWQEKEQIEMIELGELSPKMLEDFFSQRLSNNKNRISETDQILRFCSFIYDINFDYSFKELKESDNINKMIDRFNYQISETKLEMMKIKEIVNKYLDLKCNTK